MSESLTLYKLIVLYMLDKVNFPLTEAQITDFILGKEYTTYFSLRQAISELIDADLIKVETFRNSSHYHITEEGRSTLEYFGNKISPSIVADIDEYLVTNQYSLLDEVSTTADYYKTTNNDYAVECKVREKNSDLISLMLTVPTKEQANAICNNWKIENQEIYSYLMDKLMK
ncbi:DUF4364 family protein [Candidatus Galacturonibacter soehngenii]|uniref:DUF4364 family protein n=1 Tax=Candidatus Galacturonatibacter soehngenii TaxID=2307010 RepID=A0A7V7QNY5_9FIRM|nr:DUF4364 family protein [Candidatus Galacturonibacter soehngenii]KAB1440994.1 DUF4364 family protein [Candidatus Galacturonibacter soehngenii]MBA4688953.1 DUF4364 family protein [Candidatus Galacturonibacter soehngenii]